MNDLSPSHGLVAIVDDDPHMCRLLTAYLAKIGLDAVALGGGEAALDTVDGGTAAVCLDLGLDDIPGLDVLRRLHYRQPDVPVIVVTANTRVEDVVEAMRAGAYDYLAKPIDQLRFEQTVRRAVAHGQLVARMRRLEGELGERSLLDALSGYSPAMREVARNIERVRKADVNVAIMGESGTGKEVVARAIHDGGRTANGPFVALNCASVPHSLQESELFGHEKGSFTGASATHRGKFEQASGGTLFLDEVGEMAPAMQASLLRVLQERTIVRVGGRGEIPVDARVICATHRELESEVRAGRFREDLYFRLVVYPIHLPPLRDRAEEDLPLLVSELLRRSRIARDRGISRVTNEAIDVMTHYRWPGNVRELDNVIQRACLACEGPEIDLHHLPAEIRAGAAWRHPRTTSRGPRSVRFSSVRAVTPPPTPVPPSMQGAHPAANDHGHPAASYAAPMRPPMESGVGQDLTLREIESTAVRAALEACNGNVTAAARMLGVSRTKLYRDMKRVRSE